MFWRKKQLNSAEYESLITRIVKLENDNYGLKVLFDKLDNKIDDTKGFVSRKMRQKGTQEDITDNELDELRAFLGQMGYTGNAKE